MTNLIAVAAALFVLVFMGIYSPFLEINEVKLIDDQKCIIDSQAYIDNNLLGKNILLLSSDSIVSYFEGEYSCIDKIGINKEIPQKLLINIISKKPIVSINDSDLQITKDGLLLSAQSSLDLPTITIDNSENLKNGDHISESVILHALLLSDKLFKSDFIPSKIKVSKKDGIVMTSSKLLIVEFSTSIDPDIQVDSLQSILGKAKIDAEKIEKIDLRFDQPVVTYK